MPFTSQEPEKELCYAHPKGNYEIFMYSKKVAPAWENRVTIESVENKMRYDPTSFLPRLHSIPLLAIVVEGDALTPIDQAIEAYNRVPSQNKKLLIVPSDGGKLSHVTIYTNPSHTQIIAKAAAEFLAEHLVNPCKK